MKTFTFENHKGKTFTAQAENGFDVMEQANAAVIWTDWVDGMWNQVSETKFVWVVGRFFD